MNENSSNVSTSTPHHGLTADAIARRAYEIWEQEGRPENRDLHHWLRAEQELVAQQKAPAPAGGNSRADNSDTQARAGAKPAAQPARKSSGNPFPAETAGGRFVQSPPPSTSSRSRSGGK